MEAIFNRRSVRKYSDEKVEESKIEKMLRAAMQAPSAGNQQAWEFVVVRDKEMLKKLSEVSPYSKMAANADVVIAVLANEEYMRYPSYWQQDLGAATENILLQAVTEGLGSVWMAVAPREDRIATMRGIFSLPETVIPFCMVAVGYPDQEVKVADKWDENKVHYEEYKPV
ncbi:nitroreductase family protein [uncultured Ilyobacter sp.]|uniref:nitroreductase family protein n=1 Tax=uncultured Ilyobacter sp. TaxID=544433 RepID=UPI0029F4FA56|nr:nitroreductase family protein [uncultured Ilyobacter sp.]